MIWNLQFHKYAFVGGRRKEKEKESEEGVNIHFLMVF